MPAETACLECHSRLLFAQLLLTDTRESFPKLGRELTPGSPRRCFLEILTCPGDGSSWARWADRPDDPLRRLDPKNLAWLDGQVDNPPIIRSP